MKRIVFILLLLSTYAQAQPFSEANQLYQLISADSPFLLKKPDNPRFGLQFLWPNDSLTIDYGTRFPPKGIDRERLAELVKNSQFADTSAWSSQELKRVVWVDDANQSLSLSELVKTLEVSDKQVVKSYKKRINRYNAGIFNQSNNFSDRLVASLSRPVFDNQGQYAVLMLNYFHSGGKVFLFEKTGAWQIVGILTSWAY